MCRVKGIDMCRVKGIDIVTVHGKSREGSIKDNQILWTSIYSINSLIYLFSGPIAFLYHITCCFSFAVYTNQSPSLQIHSTKYASCGKVQWKSF